MIETEATETVAETPEQETASLPLSLIGGQPLKEGDVVRLKVLSVDSDNGMFDVVYAHEKPVGGINEAAAVFDGPAPGKEMA